MDEVAKKKSESILDDKFFIIGLLLILIPFGIYIFLILSNLITIIYFNRILFSFSLINQIFPIVLVTFTLGYGLLLFKSQRFRKRPKNEPILLFSKRRYDTEDKTRVTEIINEVLKITPEKRREIISLLEQKQVNLPCSRCGNTNFSILDGYFVHTLVFSESNLENDLPVVPTIVVMCNNCGNLNQHSIKKLGLLPDSEESNAS